MCSGQVNFGVAKKNKKNPAKPGAVSFLMSELVENYCMSLFWSGKFWCGKKDKKN